MYAHSGANPAPAKNRTKSSRECGERREMPDSLEVGLSLPARVCALPGHFLYLNFLDVKINCFYQNKMNSAFKDIKRSNAYIILTNYLKGEDTVT